LKKKHISMKFMKRSIVFGFLVMAMAILPGVLQGQPPPDPCPDPNDPDCPIDSGVILLITGAVVIAAKKTYDYKKANNTVRMV
jgi:hypothetical protein